MAGFLVSVLFLYLCLTGLEYVPLRMAYSAYSLTWSMHGRTHVLTTSFWEVLGV